MERDLSKNPYLVTRIETVTVWARTEAEALFLGEQSLDYFSSPDTVDMQVEELEED